MRRERSSKLVSAVSIVSLVLVSSLMILVLDSSSLASPTFPFGTNNPNDRQGPTGSLVVCLYSNENQSDNLALPRQTGPLLGIGQKPVAVTMENATTPAVVMFTDLRGAGVQSLAPGNYVLSFDDESLSIAIPFQVFVQNQTLVKVNLHGTAFPVLYSEDSGVLLTPGSVESSVYAQLNSTSPSAAVGDRVIVKVIGQTGGQILKATVLSREPATQGTEWVQLGTDSPLNPANATSIYMTTWTVSSSVSISSIGLAGVSTDACL